MSNPYAARSNRPMLVIDSMSSYNCSYSATDSSYSRGPTHIITGGNFDESNMQKIKKLGQGTGGSVWLYKHTKTGSIFAVKQLNFHQKNKRDEIDKELTVLGTIQSPFLIHYYGSFVSNDFVHIVIEYMNKGSLANLITAKHALPIPVIAAIAWQLLKGLCDLHGQKIIHRDIKPANILINSNGEVKLADFGISRELQKDNYASTIIGTYYYMSPERANSEYYEYKADVWSLGVVLLECIRGEFPFPSINNVLDIQLVYKTDLCQYYNDLDPVMYNFINGCLQKKWKNRISPLVLLQSPLFSNNYIQCQNDCLMIMQNYFQMYNY